MKVQTVLKLQQDLAAFGYGVELTGTYGTGLENVVRGLSAPFPAGAHRRHRRRLDARHA